jgi:hypothetical protein
MEVRRVFSPEIQAEMLTIHFGLGPLKALVAAPPAHPSQEFWKRWLTWPPGRNLLLSALDGGVLSIEF